MSLRQGNVTPTGVADWGAGQSGDQGLTAHVLFLSLIEQRVHRPAHLFISAVVKLTAAWMPLPRPKRWPLAYDITVTNTEDLTPRRVPALT